MYRFFSTTPLSQDSSPTFSEEEKKHMRVLRLRAQEPFEIVDGRGSLAIATYEEPITIQTLSAAPTPTTRQILALAFLEPSHLDIALEKGTELGITDFYLFPTKKSSLSHFTENRTARAHKILLSALKQSKRLFLPTLTLLPSISKLPDIPLFLADPTGSKTTPKEGSKMIVVGPESGLTPDEVSYLTNDRKATKVNLSPNILRAETAAIIASYWLAS